MTTIAMPRGLPDAYAPLTFKATSLPSIARQNRMRAHVLATTRHMLATEGHGGMKLARIAETCGVSAQTIHNSFGCRSNLIAVALNQHTEAMDRFACGISNDPLMFLHLAKAYCQVAANQPDFLRNMLMTAFAHSDPLLCSLQTYGIRLKITLLREMAGRSLLRSSIDTTTLSTQIARLNTFASYEWAIGPGDLEAFHHQIITGNGLLLMGALVPAAARAVENWICEELISRNMWLPAGAA